MTRRIIVITSICYVIGLIAGFSYVRSVLSTHKLDVSEKEQSKKVEDIKDVTVNLILQLKSPEQPKMFTFHMKSSDSIMDLLVEARKQGDFYFEHQDYLYKTVINVNDQVAPVGYRWVVVDRGRDLTNVLNDVNLTDGHAYIVGLAALPS